MDGLGNDFIIFDNREKSISLSKEQIIKISDRNNIGCDQVIFIDKDGSNNPFLKFYNSDGGEIGACGNGSRCTAYSISRCSFWRWPDPRRMRTIRLLECTTAISRLRSLAPSVSFILFNPIRLLCWLLIRARPSRNAGTSSWTIIVSSCRWASQRIRLDQVMK